MNEIKFVECISCTECEKKLNILRKSALNDFVKQRMGLMRCRGCGKLSEYEHNKKIKGVV